MKLNSSTMTHEKNMMDYQSFLQKKNLAMKPGDMLYGKSYCFDKANTHLAFLDSEPNLGDFVPTNEDGEVMDKPEKYFCIQGVPMQISKEYKAYQSALDRCLWKGDWKIVYKNTTGNYWIESGKTMFWIYKYNTYDKLITSGVKLYRINK